MVCFISGRNIRLSISASVISCPASILAVNEFLYLRGVDAVKLQRLLFKQAAGILLD
jgi:hypothetical protein